MKSFPLTWCHLIREKEGLEKFSLSIEAMIYVIFIRTGNMLVHRKVERNQGH